MVSLSNHERTALPASQSRAGRKAEYARISIQLRSPGCPADPGNFHPHTWHGGPYPIPSKERHPRGNGGGNPYAPGTGNVTPERPWTRRGGHSRLCPYLGIIPPYPRYEEMRYAWSYFQGQPGSRIKRVPRPPRRAGRGRAADSRLRTVRHRPAPLPRCRAYRNDHRPRALRCHRGARPRCSLPA